MSDTTTPPDWLGPATDLLREHSFDDAAIALVRHHGLAASAVFLPEPPAGWWDDLTDEEKAVLEYRRGPGLRMLTIREMYVEWCQYLQYRRKPKGARR